MQYRIVFITGDSVKLNLPHTYLIKDLGVTKRYIIYYTESSPYRASQEKEIIAMAFHSCTIKTIRLLGISAGCPEEQYFYDRFLQISEYLERIAREQGILK